MTSPTTWDDPEGEARAEALADYRTGMWNTDHEEDLAEDRYSRRHYA